MVLADVINDAQQLSVDACTLNNALNVVQLVVLVRLLQWVKGER